MSHVGARTPRGRERNTFSLRHASLVVALASLAAVSAASAQSSTKDQFARYETPGQCEQAAIRLKKLFWRDKRPDTVVYAPATDSVPAPVVQAARACASRFSVAKVPERELLNLAQLYTWARQDDLAQAAIDRLLKAQANAAPVDRGWTLELLSTSLLEARPTRMTTAEKYLAQLDALGAPAATWRMFTHTAFANYAITVNDEATANSEARAALAASAQMSHDDRLDWAGAIIDTYDALAQPVSILRGGHAALAVFDTATSDVLPLRPEGSREQRGLRSGIEWGRLPYTLYDSAGAALDATRWYNTESDTVRRPRPGKVSLLVFVSGSCGGNCYPMYATVRRLQAKYGPGLDVIFLATTYGFFRSQPVVSPAAERDSTASYFVNFLKFTVPFAIQETTISHLPDGRMTYGPTSNHTNYGRGRDGVLIDKRGTVVMVDTLAPDRERVWTAQIQKALNSM